MMANGSTRYSKLSLSSDAIRPSDATSTCVPMPGTAVPRTEAPWRSIATSRMSSTAIRRRDPTKKARRWVVEVCHSWFNRFRKLLVRYEKLERSFVALNHLAAAIIAFRKVPAAINIIYG